MQVFEADVSQENGGFILVFEDGQVTEAEDRDEALRMAVDLRASLDDRHPSSYHARWLSDDSLSVTAIRMIPAA